MRGGRSFKAHPPSDNLYVSQRNERDLDLGKLKIEFCIACSRDHSAGHFDTKIRYLVEHLTKLLRILSFKTCIMKN